MPTKGTVASSTSKESKKWRARSVDLGLVSLLIGNWQETQDGSFCALLQVQLD